MEGNPKFHEAPEQLGLQLPQEVFEKIHNDFNEMLRYERRKKDITNPLLRSENRDKAKEEVKSMTNEEILSVCIDQEKYSHLIANKEKFALVYARLLVEAKK